MSVIETVVRAQQSKTYLASRPQISAQQVEKYGLLMALSQDGRVDLLGQDFYSVKSSGAADALMQAKQRIEQAFVAAVIHKERLYLTNQGGCHAYLIRGGGARRITSANADSVYLPIELNKGDTVLLCVGSACQVLSTERIKVGSLTQTARQISSKAKNATDGFMLAQLRSTAALSTAQRTILSLLAVIALLQFIVLMFLI